MYLPTNSCQQKKGKLKRNLKCVEVAINRVGNDDYVDRKNRNWGTKNGLKMYKTRLYILYYYLIFYNFNFFVQILQNIK